MKTMLRKVALSIIFQSKQRVNIDILQVNYHGILNGQKIVITGGSKGIGYAMAKKFVSEGAKVVITGRNEESLINAIDALGNNASYVRYDSADTGGIDSFIAECCSKVGCIDSLVLNAGISLHEGNILNVTTDGYDKQFNINLKANYFLAQAYLKMKLEKNEIGNLLFLSSETSSKCVDIPYGLTKAAINSLVGGIARRVYQRGIRVNAIAPGVTYTDMTKGSNVIDGDYANNSIAGRFLMPEEIAEVACFILT